MRGFFCFFVFFAAFIGAKDKIAHFEGSPSGIAGGWVNVISGEIVHSEVDLQISGVEPIFVSRYPLYAPTATALNSRMEGWNFPFRERVQHQTVGSSKHYFYYYQGNQKRCSFHKEKPENSGRFPVNLEEHPKGFTNQIGGKPSGRSSLKNYCLNLEDHTVFLRDGSGERKTYHGYDQSTDPFRWLKLVKVEKPNGFYYGIDYEPETQTQGVTVYTPADYKASYYSCKHQDNKMLLTSFEGSEVAYYFYDDTIDNVKHRLLKKVERSDGPLVEYSYSAGKLSKIAYPEGRCIDFCYFQDKVYSLSQPTQPNGDMLETYRFGYYYDDKKKNYHTIVIDHDRNEDTYYVNKDYRLKRIDYGKRDVVDRCEQFFWDKDSGELKLSTICDGSYRPQRATVYNYTDKRGNINREQILGNLTGRGKALPSVNDDGRFVDPLDEIEMRSVSTSYNAINCPVEEEVKYGSNEEKKGLKTTYKYKSNTSSNKYNAETSLVTEKKTFMKGQCVKTEFFDYNEHNFLIKTVVDDGVRREIIRYTPLFRPAGYPKEKRIYGALESGEELFLESYHYAYDSQGNVTSEEKRDSKGATVYRQEWRFNAHGKCAYEKDKVGNEITRTFDDNDNCICEVGPREGIVKTFHYDKMNRCVLEEVFFHGEKVSEKHFAYNWRGHLCSVVDEYGRETTFESDRWGNNLVVQLPAIEVEGVETRPVIRQVFDIFGNVVEETDPLGRTTKKSYTSRNQVYQVVHPDGGVEKTFYTLEGDIEEMVDQEGFRTLFKRDDLGRVLSKTTPFGTERYLYTGLVLSSFIDIMGERTDYRYDPFGRLIETIVGDRREVLEYDGCGFPYRKSHFEGDTLLSTEVMICDPLERVVESYIEDPSGTVFQRKRFEYDGAGNCFAEWDGEAKTEKFYDGKNRIIRLVNPLQQESRVEYRTVGTLEEKTVIDPLGYQVMTLYNAHGKEVEIRHVDTVGAERLVRQFFYDVADQVVKEVAKGDGREQVLLYKRDSMGRVIALIEPLDKVSRSTYTKTGQIKKRTKPDGITLEYTYQNGRLSNLKSSDDQILYDYVYSKKGELIEVWDGVTGSVSKQHFSRHGDIVEEELPTGQRGKYRYDGLGRIVSYSLPDGGEAVLQYNAVTMTSVTRRDREGKELYTHAYTDFNERGEVAEQQLIGNGGIMRFTFDEVYQLTGIFHPEWAEEEMTYDAVGNLTSLKLNGEALAFGYDSLYQLNKEKEHSYTFDAFKNRTSRDGEAYTINELNEITHVGEIAYQYDKNGNLTEVGALQFGYDPLNRLIMVKKGDIEVRFAYDPFNRRISRNGKPFYFMRDYEVGDENVLRILGLGLGAEIGAAIAIETNGQVFAPLHDHVGSLVALLNFEGEVADVCRYTAFGERMGTTRAPWTYASKRYEPVTGTIAFGQRDYDPATGRWTTPDPLGFEASPNLYTYVFNQPLTKRDPLGLYVMSPFPVGNPFCDAISPCLPVISVPYEFFFFGCEPSGLHPISGLSVANRKVGFMNGMRTSLFEAMATGEYLSVLGGGLQVDVLYNATHGSFWDVAECLLGRARIATDPVALLQKEWHSYLTENPEGRYVMFCHSQGAIHVKNGLLGFDHELRRRIDVIAIGPGGYIDEDLCGSAKHIRTESEWRDFVAHVLAEGAWSSRHSETIQGVPSHPNAPYFDHSIMSSTYQEPIVKQMQFNIWGGSNSVGISTGFSF